MPPLCERKVTYCATTPLPMHLPSIHTHTHGHTAIGEYGNRLFSSKILPSTKRITHRMRRSEFNMLKHVIHYVTLNGGTQCSSDAFTERGNIYTRIFRFAHAHADEDAEQCIFHLRIATWKAHVPYRQSTLILANVIYSSALYWCEWRRPGLSIFT